MISLTRYFLWFFFICFVFSCVCGVLAALLPTGMGAVLTAVPYLVAMIWVLLKFTLYTTNFTEPLSYQGSAFLKLPKFP